MPLFCSAIGCTNSSSKKSCRERHVSFHHFPLDDRILLRRWLIKVRRENFQATRSSLLCSDHFTEEDFEYQNFTKRRALKKGAVPSKFSYDSKKRNRKRKNNMEESDQKEEFVPTYTVEDSSESEFVDSGEELNKTESDATLLDISMNERFYTSDQLKTLKNGLPKNPNSKRKYGGVSRKFISAMKEKLTGEILLRTLKKQWLEAEIKAANTKRDYYETKRTTLLKMHNVESFDNDSDSEGNAKVLGNIRSRLRKEEIAASVEDEVLTEQLEEAKKTASKSEREYYEAQSEMLYELSDN